MPYRELHFTVVAEIAEPLGDALMELGALSISVEDASAGGYDENPLYGEPGLSPEVQAWDLSSVKALFNADFEFSKEELTHHLRELGYALQTPTESIIAEQDWVSLTQSQFEPIQIGQRIWIVPSWHEKPTEPNAICLAVDPGLAFGTGSHPTTRLCLEWLEHSSQHQSIHKHTLLDYGCGSGILAIAAKKLGFTDVYGVDIDVQAIESARMNAKQNQVDIAFALPDDAAPVLGKRQFDVVMANILANPLQVLAPALIARVRDGGQIVLSGILERQARDVIQTYQDSISLSLWKESEGWVCLSGQKHAEKAKSVSIRTIADVSKSSLALGKAQHKKGGAAISLQTKILLALLLLLFAYPIVTIFWRMPLLHTLSPSLDQTPNPIALGAFDTLQKLDASICAFLPCEQKAVVDFKAWRFLLANLGMDDSKRGLEVLSILQIELQNRLLVPIAVPHLELTLSDADEKTIARILLSPEEWLPKTWQSAHPGFLLTGAPAKELFSLSIPLQLPANAAGYRLRVAYPPPSNSPSL
jgi:ribosomal protein L11 methyltransferase